MTTALPRPAWRSPEFELGQIDLDRLMIDDPDLRSQAVLAMDGARNPHRLVRRTEAAVTTDLAGDLGAQAAKTGDIRTMRGLAQLPPQMQLLLTALGDATAFHRERGGTEMADEVIALGDNIALIKIDHEGLHLQHMPGAGFATLRHRAGDDIDGAADLGGSFGAGGNSRGRTRIGRQPAQITRRGRRHALLGQAAQGDQPLAPGEDDIEKERDLRRIDRRHAHCSRPSPGSRSAGWI